jgi:flagellar protein FlbD
MVKLGRINGTEVMVNAELIETVEATPDTIITLTSGKKLMVMESVDQVVEKVMAYRRSLLAPEGDLGGHPTMGGSGTGVGLPTPQPASPTLVQLEGAPGPTKAGGPDHF